uniref:Uncharacterized protein n=1 Tax=Panagrolaimus davidi TaxID=227884 RepID=A0A914PMC1_9BILA
MDTPNRDIIKQNILNILGTETVRPSVAAQCISRFELPPEQWIEVIDKLMKNVMDDASAEKLKDSSLEALGYICQNVGAAIGESKSNFGSNCTWNETTRTICSTFCN